MNYQKKGNRFRTLNRSEFTKFLVKFNLRDGRAVFRFSVSIRHKLVGKAILVGQDDLDLYFLITDKTPDSFPLIKSGKSFYFKVYPSNEIEDILKCSIGTYELSQTNDSWMKLIKA